MELDYVVKKIDSSEPLDHFILDGFSPLMLKASFKVRSKIVDWYSKKLDVEVKQLGNYKEGADGRKFVRGDLLALEQVRRGRDIPESGPERKNEILSYLLDMTKPGTWGGCPEYTAAAIMTSKTIRVWQKNQEGQLTNINSAFGGTPEVITTNIAESEENESTIEFFNDDAQMDAEIYSSTSEAASFESLHLSEFEDEPENDNNDYNLFFEGNHYQAMVSRQKFMKIVAVYGELKNFRPILED